MTDLSTAIALLLGSAVLIYLSCEYFVNGVEWLGRRLAVGQQATGTILAAFGTALPESVVTFVAVAFGADAASRQLGIGAALGGPLALATIGYATVGIVLLATGRRLPRGEAHRGDYAGLARDQRWFLLIFAAKIALGVTAFAIKPWLGLLFLAAYALYVRQEMRGGAAGDEPEIEPLRFAPRAAELGLGAILLQTGGALGVIFLASRLFVEQLGQLGPALGLPPQVLALLLSPIATELPETMNAIIWVRQGKYRLALGNISGAMMIQATIPTSLGLFFTPWQLGPALLLGAGATAVAILMLYIGFARGNASRRLLAAMVLPYLVFAGALALIHPGSS